MNLPSFFKPFPIPVVALGPGSQAADDEDDLHYLSMPQGMSTYRAPLLPEPEEMVGHTAAVDRLHATLAALTAWLRGERGAAVQPVLLNGLSSADLALIHQVMGEGDVSAQVLDPVLELGATPDRAEVGATSAPAALSARVQLQESVFAGVWRVLERLDDGTVRDTLEVGPVPEVLRRMAREDARPMATATLEPPPGVMNADAILCELAEHRQHWRAGQPPQVVNLSLLPVTPQDIAWIDHRLGTGRVQILSRGYGNCRITNTCVANTWRVVYYNSQDTVILNSVEVIDLPEVACAAHEDLEDSHERLTEVLQWVTQG